MLRTAILSKGIEPREKLPAGPGVCRASLSLPRFLKVHTGIAEFACIPFRAHGLSSLRQAYRRHCRHHHDDALSCYRGQPLKAVKLNFTANLVLLKTHNCSCWKWLDKVNDVNKIMLECCFQADGDVAEDGWVRSMIAAGATTLAPVLGRMVPNPAAGPRPPSASKGSTSSSKDCAAWL